MAVDDVDVVDLAAVEAAAELDDAFALLQGILSKLGTLASLRYLLHRVDSNLNESAEADLY